MLIIRACSVPLMPACSQAAVVAGDTMHDAATPLHQIRDGGENKLKRRPLVDGMSGMPEPPKLVTCSRLPVCATLAHFPTI